MNSLRQHAWHPMCRLSDTICDSVIDALRVIPSVRPWMMLSEIQWVTPCVALCVILCVTLCAILSVTLSVTPYLTPSMKDRLSRYHWPYLCNNYRHQSVTASVGHSANQHVTPYVTWPCDITHEPKPYLKPYLTIYLAPDEVKNHVNHRLPMP